MSKRVCVDVQVRLFLHVEEDVDVDTIMADLDYEFRSQTEGVSIEGHRLRSYDEAPTT